MRYRNKYTGKPDRQGSCPPGAYIPVGETHYKRMYADNFNSGLKKLERRNILVQARDSGSIKSSSEEVTFGPETKSQ